MENAKFKAELRDVGDKLIRVALHRRAQWDALMARVTRNEKDLSEVKQKISELEAKISEQGGNTMTNKQAIAYAVLAMRAHGLSEAEIDRIVANMYSLMDELTPLEAERKAEKRTEE